MGSGSPPNRCKLFCVFALFYIEVPELPWRLATVPTPTLSQISVTGHIGTALKQAPLLNLREEEAEAKPPIGRTGGEVKVMVTGQTDEGEGKLRRKNATSVHSRKVQSLKGRFRGQMEILLRCLKRRLGRWAPNGPRGGPRPTSPCSASFPWLLRAKQPGPSATRGGCSGERGWASGSQGQAMPREWEEDDQHGDGRPGHLHPLPWPGWKS